MKRVILGFAVLACIGTTATASTMYYCTFKNNGTAHNLPDEVFMEYDDKTGKVMVMDPFVNHYVGDPVEAEVIKNTDKRLTVTWSLGNIKAKHGGTIVGDRTRLTLIKATMEASVVYMQSGATTHSGFGTCSVE